MLKILKFLLPVLLLFSGIAFIFAFEFYIKDRMNTVPVVVAAKDITFKEAFSPNNLVVTHIKRDHMVKGAFTNESSISDLLGQVAAIDISQGTQLYEALVDYYDLVPNQEAGEFIAPIPNEWIFAIPGSLRRSYVANFYIVSNEQQKELAEIFTQEDHLSEVETNESPSITETEDQPIIVQPDQRAIVIDSSPVLENVKIVYTKDSSNREVRNIQDTQHDATANISNIEIIATQDILNQLKNYTSQGYLFYITYKYSR